MEPLCEIPEDSQLENYYINKFLRQDAEFEPFLSHENPKIIAPTKEFVYYWRDWDSYLTKLHLIKTLIKSRVIYFPLAYYPLNLLDYGCGLGFYLYSLADTFTYLIGTEINFYSKRYAKELNKLNPNVSVRHTVENNDSVEGWNGHFNFILLIDFIEHHNEPEKLLKKAYLMLNKDGYLIISVPVKENKNFQIDFTVQHGHLWRFTKSSIEKLLQDCGFVVDYYMGYDAKRFTPFEECIILAKKKEGNPPGYKEKQIDLYE